MRFILAKLISTPPWAGIAPPDALVTSYFEAWDPHTFTDPDAVALLIEVVALLPICLVKFLMSRSGRRAYGV